LTFRQFLTFFPVFWKEMLNLPVQPKKFYMRKLFFIIAIAMPGFAWAQDDTPDPVMVQKIRNEGLNNSQVMEIVFYLTEASGPRLNNSPGYLRAANWAKSKLTEWG